MNLSISVSTEDVDLTHIVFRGKLPQMIDKVSTCGYSAVDLFTHSVRSMSKPEISLLKERGISVVLLSSFGYMVEQGWHLAHPEPSIRDAIISEMPAYLDTAAELGAMIPIGYIRGPVTDGLKLDDYRKRLGESLAVIQEMAQQNQVKLIIEPINRYEINSINTVDQAIGFLEQERLDGIGLLLDTFHMNIEDSSIEAGILKAAGRIDHVHLSDSSRYPMGMGHLNLKKILHVLKALHYSGYYGIESFPYPNPEEAAVSCRDYFMSMVRQVTLANSAC